MCASSVRIGETVEIAYELVNNPAPFSRPGFGWSDQPQDGLPRHSRRRQSPAGRDALQLLQLLGVKPDLQRLAAAAAARHSRRVGDRGIAVSVDRLGLLLEEAEMSMFVRFLAVMIPPCLHSVAGVSLSVSRRAIAACDNVFRPIQPADP